jgi:hypothetical protein
MTGTLILNGLIINHWATAAWSSASARFAGITTLTYVSAA